MTTADLRRLSARGLSAPMVLGGSRRGSTLARCYPHPIPCADDHSAAGYVSRRPSCYGYVTEYREHCDCTHCQNQTRDRIESGTRTRTVTVLLVFAALIGLLLLALSV